MTNPKKTLIAALLDRTGSMIESKEATEKGFDEMINGQKQEPGECIVTLGQFDRHGNAPILTRVYSNLPIHQVPKLDIQPRGMTPLLDAIGEFVVTIGKELAGLPEENRPGVVICLIMTDGEENSSYEWNLEGVKKIVEQQTQDYGWHFMFIGANIDGMAAGASMGIAAAASASYNAADDAAVMDAYSNVSRNVSGLRSGVLAQAAFTDEERVSMMGSGAGSKK